MSRTFKALIAEADSHISDIEACQQAAKALKGNAPQSTVDAFLAMAEQSRKAVCMSLQAALRECDGGKAARR